MALSITIVLPQAALTVLAGYILWAYYVSPLRKIPGPALARFTDLWRFASLLGRQPEVAQRKLHDELGPIVRLGPNMVSLSDPAMVEKIYSRKTILIKGDFYVVHDLNVNGTRIPNVFSTRDEQMNTQFLKPVMKLYSMGHLVQLEPRIDDTIQSFLNHMTRRFAKPGLPCDIDNWLHYVAWDVIADLTFSKRMGFMEDAKDVENMLSINHAALDYVSAVGMMPWLDHCLERNPIKRVGPPAYVPLINFILGRIQRRVSGEDGHDQAAPDMLDGFLEARKANPEDIQENALLAYMFANVAAGSDTVAAELRSTVYYLCKHPKALATLQKELDASKVSTPVTWAQCQNLPYLGACVLEGMRIFPGAALPLERRVGPDGLLLSDGKTFLPPDTMVGINPYVINRDRGVFGDDAHTFRPERWLKATDETEATFQQRLSRMKQTDLTFGAGKRVCVGRNIALIECYKIIASLVHNFDLELVHPEREWKTHNAWLTRQSDMDIKLSPRRSVTV